MSLLGGSKREKKFSEKAPESAGEENGQKHHSSVKAFGRISPCVCSAGTAGSREAVPSLRSHGEAGTRS